MNKAEQFLLDFKMMQLKSFSGEANDGAIGGLYYKYFEKEREGIEPETDEIKIPEPLDIGWHITFNSDDGCSNSNITDSKKLKNNMAFFQYEAEAKRQARKWVLTRKLEDLSESVNEGWKPDWNDAHDKKWYFSYNYLEGGKVSINNNDSFQYPNTVYFKSEKIIKKCLESKSVLAVLNELRELQ